MDSIREQIIQQIDGLTPDQQAHLLAVARHLHQSHLPPGMPGESLLAARDRFTFTPGDVDEMMSAIE
ncbi:MAG: hypothetical protein K8I60_07470 [Anaerolineae bacterium]|nr:hypothetical protein [Anaerolineae bacterium]